MTSCGVPTAPSHGGGTMSATQRSCVGMAHGAITAGRECPPTTPNSQRRLVFHRVVRRARRGFWSDWQEQVEELCGRDARVCADQIRRCFRHPGHARVSLESMVWSTNSTPSSPQDHHVDPFAQRRRHFSKFTLCRSSDFDPCFAAAVSDQFRACCADHPSGGFDATLSDPELVRALAQC